jgi:cold shock CspA family protein
MRTGICVRWERSYGWIKDDDDNNEYFCHYTNITGEGFKFLDVGDYCEFELGPGNRTGLQTINVKRL